MDYHFVLGEIQGEVGVPFVPVGLAFPSERVDEVLVGHHPEDQECPCPVSCLEDLVACQVSSPVVLDSMVVKGLAAEAFQVLEAAFLLVVAAAVAGSSPSEEEVPLDCPEEEDHLDCLEVQVKARPVEAHEDW